MFRIRYTALAALLLVAFGPATTQSAAQDKKEAKTPLPKTYVVLEKDGFGNTTTVLKVVGELKVTGPKNVKYTLKDGVFTAPKWRAYLRPGEGEEITMTTEGVTNPGLNIFIPSKVPVFVGKPPDDYKTDRAVIVLKDGWDKGDAVFDLKGLKVDVDKEFTSETKDGRTLIRSRRLYLREGAFKDATTRPSYGPFKSYPSVELEVPSGVPIFMKAMP